jgi:hypothetical protein
MSSWAWLYKHAGNFVATRGAGEENVNILEFILKW